MIASDGEKLPDAQEKLAVRHQKAARHVFPLVSRRYERSSIIITSNQSLGAWGKRSAMR